MLAGTRAPQLRCGASMPKAAMPLKLSSRFLGWPLGCFVRVECGADFVDVGSVGADSVMELVSGNSELF